MGRIKIAPSSLCHILCRECWDDECPRDPAVVPMDEPEACCNCGQDTKSGILVTDISGIEFFCGHAGGIHARKGTDETEDRVFSEQENFNRG